MKQKKRAAGDAARLEPVAIVDIGSNSVRLVVYDGLRRSPAPIFNEKILCGLGRGLSLTGRLSDAAMARALRALRRFRILCRQIRARPIWAVATAASREAKNGPEFVAEAEQALGQRIALLSGQEEAEFSALGVVSGIPEADGVVGDLGGGSLELIEVKGGKVRQGVTLPLGPLRLIDQAQGSLERATAIVDQALAPLPLLEALAGRSFYAVGGTWRNLARLHMAQTQHPLGVLHHYLMPRPAVRSIAGLLAGLSSGSVREIPAISKSRAETMPYGALVLDRLLKRSKAENVVVSIWGLREGLLYSKLDRKEARRDPLLSACWDFALRYARSARHERELCAWTDRLFEGPRLDESAAEKRLRHAACLLADIGWRTHPNYRGERSLTIISQASFVGVDHPGRAFLALTVFFRYCGSTSDAAPAELVHLVDGRALERARIISAAQRVAYVLSGAMPGMLPLIGLGFASRTLVLTIPKARANLMGERVEKRLAELASALGCAPEVRIGE